MTIFTIKVHFVIPDPFVSELYLSYIDITSHHPD